MANAETIEKLKLKRGTYKAQITRYRQFIEEYKLKEPDLIKLNVRVDKFKSIFAEFDRVSDDLEFLDEEHDHATETFQIEEFYLDLITESEHLKQSARTIPHNDFADENEAQDTIIERSSTATVTKRRIKLPEASLPKFSGKYEDWLSYKDGFESMILNQNDLNKIEKLQYLKSAITG